MNESDESHTIKELIFWVECHPFLYDKNNEDYKKERLKDKVFEEFAKTHGHDGK